MGGFADLQHRFAAALRDPSALTPLSIRQAGQPPIDRRFAVHRNNMLSSLVSGLARRFPVTRRLLGDEAFRALACRYVSETPPRSPILLHYGETFADVIAAWATSGLAHVADVTRLEMARGRAYHAADADPVTAVEFERLRPDHLDRICIELHPSVSLVSSSVPIVSIWEAHRIDAPAGRVEPWVPESALIARPFAEVEVWRLPAGGPAFFGCLGRGRSMGEALAAGLAAEPAFDLAANLILLVKSHSVVRLFPAEPGDGLSRSRGEPRAHMDAPCAEARARQPNREPADE